MSRELQIGLMPLTDCVPLVVASARGFFAAEGLEVSLVREQSWATIRDKVAFGALDGAMMLAPMPLAMSFEPGHQPGETLVPLFLSLNGNGITIGTPLLREIEAAAPHSVAKRPIRADGLARVIDARREAGQRKLRFGVVFTYSSHMLQVRWWLRDAGIDPDTDVELVIVPPAQMATQLEQGLLDGYCVGEPWNQLAVRSGLGHVLVTSYELWQNAPEKVLGVSAAMERDAPEELQALLRAIISASAWLDRPENRLEAAALLVDGGWVAAPVEVVGLSLVGIVADGLEGGSRRIPDMHVFHRYAANFPWLSHGRIYADAMATAGQLPHGIPDSDIARIFRPDLYRRAAEAVGADLPRDDRRAEGGHASDWTMPGTNGPIHMGPNRFFEGRGLPGIGNGSRGAGT